MRVIKILQHFREYGFIKYSSYLLVEIINRVMLFRVLVGMRLTPESINPELVTAKVNFEGRFLSIAELEKYSSDSRYDLDLSFLEQVSHKGDRCYGFFDQGKLVSYGWYTREPVQFVSGSELHFDTDYIYMYKGFTLDAYRGQRLHAIGMVQAMHELMQNQSAKGLISYVDATNFPSLKSVYRLGYVPFGYCVAIKIFGTLFTWSSPGCKEYKFWICRTSAANVNPSCCVIASSFRKI